MISPAKFLQIWVFPKVKNGVPRYDQVSLNMDDRYNKLQQIVSPNRGEEGVWINQDAWFHLRKFDKGFSTAYEIRGTGKFSGCRNTFDGSADGIKLITGRTIRQGGSYQDVPKDSGIQG